MATDYNEKVSTVLDPNGNKIGAVVEKGDDGEFQVPMRVKEALPEGSNVIGALKLTDGTTILVINTDGSINVRLYDSNSVEKFTSANPGIVTVSGGDIATATNQSSVLTKLESIVTKTALVATQATLAEILTLLGSQATATGQANIIAAIPATTDIETALADILAKIITTPATEAKQDDIISALTGSVADVTLQDAATEAGNGTAYAPSKTVMLTFEITGTSTSRTIVFEMAGPSGTFVSQQCINVSDNTFATQTTGGDDTTPESWMVMVPAGWTFRARISAISDGNISISGKAG